jgi:predicted kinase
MRKIILVRGVPGCGKSTLTDLLMTQTNISADDYFMVNGEYCWEASKVSLAHSWCRGMVKNAMECGETISVHNTFTTEWEMEPYFKLAKEYDYQITTIVVENRHGSKDVHNVPTETIDKMKARFQVKL